MHQMSPSPVGHNSNLVLSRWDHCICAFSPPSACCKHTHLGQNTWFKWRSDWNINGYRLITQWTSLDWVHAYMYLQVLLAFFDGPNQHQIPVLGTLVSYFPLGKPAYFPLFTNKATLPIIYFGHFKGVLNVFYTFVQQTVCMETWMHTHIPPSALMVVLSVSWSGGEVISAEGTFSEWPRLAGDGDACVSLLMLLMLEV